MKYLKIYNEMVMPCGVIDMDGTFPSEPSNLFAKAYDSDGRIVGVLELGTELTDAQRALFVHVYDENMILRGNVPAYVTEKNVQNPNIILTPSSFVYSGNPCVPEVVVKDGETVVPASEYTVTITDNINAGSAMVTITDKVGGEYKVSGMTTFQIAKITPTVVAPTAKTLSYTGNAQELVNAGSTNYGTLQYSLDNEIWGIAIPSATNAGDYTVYYRVVGDANHADVAAQTVACSIAKVAPVYTAPTGKNDLEYTGEAQALLNAGSTENGTFKYSLDGTTWSENVPTGTEAQTYTVYWKLDGDANHNDVAQSTISVEIESPSPTDFVDLGLPSGLLWATGNIVSDGNGGYEVGEETDYGAYFSWGNIVPHFSANGSTFDDSYDFGTSDSGQYASTPGASLSADISTNDAQHDAALALLGSPWHLPTKNDFQELYDNTDKEWATINGIKGRKFMKKTEHSVYIFLPVAGFGEETSLSNRGTHGRYWSSSYDSSSGAYNLFTDSSMVVPQGVRTRYNGLSVRAVQ